MLADRPLSPVAVIMLEALWLLVAVAECDYRFESIVYCGNVVALLSRSLIGVVSDDRGSRVEGV